MRYCIFFSASFDLASLMHCWQRLIVKQAELVKIKNMAVIFLDGIKLSKEGLKLPGNKWLYQSSAQ